uniref:Pre-mRNA splicing Prp18-interacting factor n=1 Tax=Tanacetum cinerariifolium TaxID=118510 RepID=A0A6L2LP23_TANCI|nr:hypothetical protein [Tanacetum cinerariifolium]
MWEQLFKQNLQKCSWCGGPFNRGNCRCCTNVSFRDEPVYDSNPNSYNQTPDFSNPLPNHNYETDSRSDTVAAFQVEFAKLQQNFELFYGLAELLILCGLFDGENCPSCNIVGAKNKFVHDPNLFPYDNTPDFYDHPPQHHESNEFIKSSVEDLVPILGESEDTSDSDKECDLPFYDNYVIFSNPLFDANDDFTSSNEGVFEEKVKIYSNPLFEFDDEYISSDVNPLFNEVLEDIENKDSYVSNLDKLALLVTPLFDANKDECFDPGGDIDEIDAFLDIDVSTNIEDGYHD